MSRKPYDPLAFIPSPDVIREKLRETLTLAERLRLLLDLAERIGKPNDDTTNFVTSSRTAEVSRG